MASTTVVSTGKERVIENAEEFLRIPLKDIVADANIREIKESDAGMKELAQSIEEQGVREPVLVRPHPEQLHKVQLVVGHRRRLGAMMVGLKEIPAIKKSMTDAEMREVQLVENIQREDLDPVDEARAFKNYLVAVPTATQKSLGEKVGKSQPYVANRIRLLDLPKNVVELMRDGTLTASHAEVLASIPKEAPEIMEEVLEWMQDPYGDQMSVKDAAKEVRWKVEAWERERKAEDERQQKLDAFKFNKCPHKSHMKTNLSTPPSATGIVYGTKDTLECSKFHHWSGTTGKLIEAKAEKEEKYGNIGLGSTTYKAPKVKREATPVEPKTFRSFHTAASIGKVLVKGIPDGQITRVSLTKHYGGEHEIRLFVRGFDEKKMEFTVEPHPYSSGEKARVEISAWDDKRRKELRQAFDAWKKKALPKISVKAKPSKAADPKLLEGSIDTVAKKLPKNDELLESLRAIEVKGKKRKGVIDLIDMRLSLRRSVFE